MWKNRAVYGLAVGGLLSLLTAGLLFLVAQDRMTPEVNQILVLIAGMTTVAALTAFQQSVENSTSPSFVDVSFNETLVSQSLSEGDTIPNPSPADGEKVAEPWDLSLGQLVGLDNSLALAKLRMELERELRHIAYNNQTDISAPSVRGYRDCPRTYFSKNFTPYLAWSVAGNYSRLQSSGPWHGSS